MSIDDKSRHGRVRLVPCSHCIEDVAEIQVESECDSFCLSTNWNYWSSSLDQHLPGDALNEVLSSPVGFKTELLGNSDDEL